MRLLLAGLVLSAAIAMPAAAWVKTLGSVGYDGAGKTVLDASGNVFVTGLNAGTMDFGGTACTGTIFVAKYSSTGVLLWAQCFGGAGGGAATGMALDLAGNIVLTGHFRGKVDFGGGLLDSGDGYDGFLAKYSATGAHLWSRRFGAALPSAIPTDSGNGVATDAAGNVFVTGAFEGATDFGGVTVVSAGQTDAFLAKYSPVGALVWVKRWGGLYSDQGNAVATDLGNVIVTGTYLGTVDFGTGSLVSSGYDGFLAKFDTTGAPLWSQHFGGVLWDTGNALAIDLSGNIVVTGVFWNTVAFGTTLLTSAGGGDIFLVKYGPTGVVQWAQRFGSTSAYDAGNALAVDGSGNVILAGTFAGTADFGGGPLTSAGSKDAFVAKFSPTGASQWSRRFGGPTIDAGQSVASDAVGNVVLFGEFMGTADFGTGPVVSAGGSDLFLAYLPSGVTPPMSTSTTSTSSSSSTSSSRTSTITTSSSTSSSRTSSTSTSSSTTSTTILCPSSHPCPLP